MRHAGVQIITPPVKRNSLPTHPQSLNKNECNVPSSTFLPTDLFTCEPEQLTGSQFGGSCWGVAGEGRTGDQSHSALWVMSAICSCCISTERDDGAEGEAEAVQGLEKAPWSLICLLCWCLAGLHHQIKPRPAGRVCLLPSVTLQGNWAEGGGGAQQG